MKLEIPHSVLKRIVNLLERMCNLVHPFDSLEIKLTGRHCNLALLSLYLDEKWDTKEWEVES